MHALYHLLTSTGISSSSDVSKYISLNLRAEELLRDRHIDEHLTPIPPLVTLTSYGIIWLLLNHRLQAQSTEKLEWLLDQTESLCLTHPTQDNAPLNQELLSLNLSLTDIDQALSKLFEKTPFCEHEKAQFEHLLKHSLLNENSTTSHFLGLRAPLELDQLCQELQQSRPDRYVGTLANFKKSADLYGYLSKTRSNESTVFFQILFLNEALATAMAVLSQADLNQLMLTQATSINEGLLNLLVVDPIILDLLLIAQTEVNQYRLLTSRVSYHQTLLHWALDEPNVRPIALKYALSPSLIAGFFEATLDQNPYGFYDGSSTDCFQFIKAIENTKQSLVEKRERQFSAIKHYLEGQTNSESPLTQELRAYFGIPASLTHHVMPHEMALLHP